jgi:hypothetical protein
MYGLNQRQIKVVAMFLYDRTFKCPLIDMENGITENESDFQCQRSETSFLAALLSALHCVIFLSWKEKQFLLECTGMISMNKNKQTILFYESDQVLRRCNWFLHVSIGTLV